jgi:flagellar motor switch protein FliG
LAGRKAGDGKLSGAHKSAVVLMSIDEESASKIFAMMAEDEIREISHAMSSLGSLKSETVDNLLREFINQISEGGDFVGGLDAAEKLLKKALGKERVESLMEEIAGPAGRTTWDKLNNVGEDILAAYLKNEYPQTAALILSKVSTAQAARVLSVLPDDFALEAIQRMMTMEPVKKEVLAGIEKALQAEFVSNLAVTKKADSFETIAEIFNNFDRNTEGKFFELLDKENKESAEKIRDLMFTFEDLVKIDDTGIQAILRVADKDKLAAALKGANDEMREIFFRNMSERAAKILKEDMESKGPMKMRDVDEAQTSVVTSAKELIDSGEIELASEDEEEMIY